jgi:hypothetical protein
MKLHKGSLLIKVVNGGFPRLAKFVAIFAIKIIRMFFYFKSFPNESSGVVRGEARILVWSKKMRCLDLKECSTIADLEIRLWVVSTICSLRWDLKDLPV